jgi:hypothetical protein
MRLIGTLTKVVVGYFPQFGHCVHATAARRNVTNVKNAKTTINMM